MIGVNLSANIRFKLQIYLMAKRPPITDFIFFQAVQTNFLTGKT
jgi:hypothetical protein